MLRYVNVWDQALRVGSEARCRPTFPPDCIWAIFWMNISPTKFAVHVHSVTASTTSTSAPLVAIPLQYIPILQH